jgi:hypothetical protein
MEMTYKFLYKESRWYGYYKVHFVEEIPNLTADRGGYNMYTYVLAIL